VDPDLEVLVVAPICPHTLSDRPIVVGAKSIVEVRMLDRPDSIAEIACDGHALGRLAPGGTLAIRPATQRVTLLHPAGYDYFRLLRSKLNWGRRSFDAVR
jgi:NAD+ kinase